MASELTAAERARQLTKRQREVVRLVTEGLSAREVAERLSISACTVHEHVRHIYGHLGCHNRAQLMRLAPRAGFCEDRDAVGRVTAA